MAVYRITAMDGGCGSHPNYIETFKDGVKYWPASGSFTYPCTTTHKAYVETTYINQFKVSGNTIYWNDVLYWSGSTPPPPPPGQNVTIQIRNVGNGRVWTSGATNALADRASITVPVGTQVYFEARPANGETFLRFDDGNGAVTTQNPFNPTVNANGTMTGHFSGSTRPKDNTLLYAVVLVLAYLIWRKI